MAGGSRRVLYLDTCIFLIRDADDGYSQETRSAVRSLFAQYEAGELILATSIIARTEILESRSSETVQLLNDLRYDSRFAFIGVDFSVCTIASRLRDNYRVPTRGQDGIYREKVISTPDSLHLASAISQKIDTFVTVDDRGGFQTCKLLSLRCVSDGGVTLNLSLPEACAGQLILPGNE